MTRRTVVHVVSGFAVCGLLWMLGGCTRERPLNEEAEIEVFLLTYPTPEEAREETRILNRRIAEFYHLPDSLLPFFHEDAVVVIGEKTYASVDYAKMARSLNDESAWVKEIRTDRFTASGNLAFESGMVYQFVDGDSSNVTPKPYLAVYERKNGGEWRIASYVVSGQRVEVIDESHVSALSD